MKIYVRSSSDDDKLYAYRDKLEKELIDKIKNGRKDPYWIADEYFSLKDMFRYEYGIEFDEDQKVYNSMPEKFQDAVHEYWEEYRGD